jgi:hypothetical protein
MNKRGAVPRVHSPPCSFDAVSPSPRFESDKVCVMRARQDQQIEKENKRERGSRLGGRRVRGVA